MVTTGAIPVSPFLSWHLARGLRYRPVLYLAPVRPRGGTMSREPVRSVPRGGRPDYPGLCIRRGQAGARIQPPPGRVHAHADLLVAVP